MPVQIFTLLFFLNLGTYLPFDVTSPKKLEKNHKQWKMLRQSHFLEYVDISDSEKVEEFVEREGVRPVGEKSE